MLDNQLKQQQREHNNMANVTKKMLPIEILADAKVEAGLKKEEKLQQKSHKTKSILNWLKTSTANNNTTTTTNANALETTKQQNNNISNNINSCQRHNPQSPTTQRDLSQNQRQQQQQQSPTKANNACATDECTCALLTQRQQILLITPTTLGDETLREFRGVQTLRHLWNKRITANKESALRAKAYSRQQQQQQNFSKSQSCLLTTSSEGEPPPLADFSPTEALESALPGRKLRAQSLYDCSGEFEEDPFALTALEIQKHLEKDNFYKYKTAEQASKLRELSEQHSAARRFSAGLLLPWVQQSYSKSERLQWLKRPEVFCKRKVMDNSNTKANKTVAIDCNEMDSQLDLVINDNSEDDRLPNGSVPRASCQDHHNATSHHGAANSTPRQSTCNSFASPKRLRSTDSVQSGDSLVSRNSSTASLATSSGRPAVRKNSSRKYSFKTHKSTYNARRKMYSSSKENTSSGSVAKLTQQFNEIIQHDTSILAEIKRNNGRVMHKGRVYKVVETTNSSSSSHAALSKTFSNGKLAAASNSLPGDTSSVQKVIRKFESRSQDKPKVPEKTSKVREKSNEWVVTKLGKVIHPSRLKAGNLNKQEKEGKIPPNSLTLPTTLEMVKEESKTPIGEQNDFASDRKQREEMKEPKLETDGSQTLLANREIISEETIDGKPLKEDEQSANRGNLNEETIQSIELTEELKPENLGILQQDETAESSEIPQEFSETPDNQTIHSMVPLKEKDGQPETSRNSQEFPEPQFETEHEFFEEISKPNRTIEKEFRTSAIYRKVKRKSSIVLQDDQRDILIYVKEEKDNLQPPTIPRKLGKKDRSLKSCSLPKNKSSPKKLVLPYKPTDLEMELNKEVKEKLNTLPRFSHLAKEAEEEDKRKTLHYSEVKPAEKDKAKAKEKEKIYSKDRSNSLSPQDNPDSSLEDSKKGKTRHSKFYEKFFFSLSRKNPKASSQQTTESPPKTEAEELPLEEAQTELSLQLGSVQLPNYTPMSSPVLKPKKSLEDLMYSSMYVPESGLLDALHQVDEKLHSLSKNEDQLSHAEPEEESKTNQSPERKTDEYGQKLKANSSFLHQSYTQVLPKPTQLIQAVNVTLVNSIEGEQMIMEQKEIKQAATKEEQEDTPAPTKEQIPSEEPLYEPIVYEESFSKPKTEMNPLEKETSSKQNIGKEEDIYQTVEELQREIYMKKQAEAEKKDTYVSNSSSVQQLLDDYEVIGDPIEISQTMPPLSLNTSQKSQDFDGYEEYAPSVETTTVTTPMTNTSTLNTRKTTDELPDLPKPKRIMPKSPLLPHRIAPTPSTYDCPKIPPPPLPTLPCKTDESHYYADEEENIYDTIKGSDCYESLQAVGEIKLEKSSSASTKNSDSMSNCYESISNFKPTRPPSHHSASSHGSTLTISSDNKTNSLYEDSLGPISRYSSKRIYRRNTDTHSELQDDVTTKANNNSSGSSHYNSSMGRASDISDEWTDVSENDDDGDGDDDGGKPKLKFQIVREKAHKSPDWSRRVRDKRLHHQRKSRSYIEDDDPDHYYEQLSPGALNKRHSLGLQERGGSLQRNQNMVRVSKRGKQISYSAHALGQHLSDDSFDSDTDDYYESELHAHNDSGVDIRTSKLPDPPASSNQMYSFVKKFKNFLAKKSPNSSKHGGSQQKIDDAASQFYVNGNFQNGEQTKSSLQIAQTKELSTSEKNLILAQSNVTKAEQLNTSTTPRKPKTGKSLRHRIRKSLVGFDNKQLATLTPTRSTFYVEEPGNLEDSNGQLDSGFSEKREPDVPLGGTANTPDTHKYMTSRKMKKEAKTTANGQRRRTTIGIRPIEPPPPPPDGNANMKRQSNTSWYAECGVFKNGTTNLVHDDSQLLNGQNDSGNNTAGGASWYEEAGLYQTSGVSVASSSGSSGVSTSNEACPADEMSHSLFSNEPLYQIYSAAKLEAISRDMQDESSTDGYEEVGDRRRSSQADGEGHRKSSRPTALQLVEPKSGPERTLWSQIPEVVNSMIIPTLAPRQRALMEAKFEIITSEASYLKSLNLLRNHYMNHPVFRDQNVVNSRDRKALFAHIVPVHECSERLLSELESCWQDNIMLIGLSKRIYAIAEKHFHVYIGFCEHQGRMDRTLKRLRASKGLFSQNLELLESNSLCCGLNLHSFLMLPMQRITRLPLLIDAVFSKCLPNDDEYENWKMCLAIMNKIVTQCNEAANKSDQAFEIEKISRQLEFNPSVIRPLAIAPAGVLAPGTKPRFLVKKGEFTHLIWRGDDAKLTFGKKFTKTTIYAFLFSDLLVLTKRKGEEQFSVFDYCPRNMLTITSGDSLPQVPTKDLNSQTSKNLILMTLLENHQRKTNELLLSCPSVSEQERWLQAMRPPESETPGEKLYEQWDCPQVIAKHAYENNEPDGLNLEVGDVINVTRKLPDGWYKGERIRDGTVGWFPGSYTEEVNSAHVRARNLKLRHRLLTFTATYLESQKRNK